MGKQLRRKRTDEEEGADAGGTAAAPCAAPTALAALAAPAKPAKPAKPASAAPKVSLSFDPDEEGPLVKLKKKKKKSHAVRERGSDAEQPLGLATGCSYSAEYLQALRGQQLRSTPTAAIAAAPSPEADGYEAAARGADEVGPASVGAGVVEAAEPPDDATIRAARAQRERLRRSAEDPMADEVSNACGALSGGGTKDNYDGRTVDDYIALEGAKERRQGGGGGHHLDSDDEEYLEGCFFSPTAPIPPICRTPLFPISHMLFLFLATSSSRCLVWRRRTCCTPRGSAPSSPPPRATHPATLSCAAPRFS